MTSAICSICSSSKILSASVITLMFDAHCKLAHDILNFNMVNINLSPSPLLQEMFSLSTQDLHATQICNPILLRIGIVAMEWLRGLKELSRETANGFDATTSPSGWLGSFVVCVIFVCFLFYSYVQFFAFFVQTAEMTVSTRLKSKPSFMK